jgi:hypothetical protein
MSEIKGNLVAKICGQNIYTSKKFEEKIESISTKNKNALLDKMFNIIFNNIIKMKDNHTLKENEAEIIITSDFQVKIFEVKK